jgi:hypothetical protein
MVSKVRPTSFDETSLAVAELKDALSSGDDYRLVALLKKFIPEYLSNNSRFGHLDKEQAQGLAPKNQLGVGFGERL